jgi:hypothetical protein
MLGAEHGRALPTLEPVGEFAPALFGGAVRWAAGASAPRRGPFFALADGVDASGVRELRSEVMRPWSASAEDGLWHPLNERGPIGVAEIVQDDYDCMLLPLLQRLRADADQTDIDELLGTNGKIASVSTLWTAAGSNSPADPWGALTVRMRRVRASR